MSIPDYSKYNEAQLRQCLTRIDHERFPERVKEIEARLGDFERRGLNFSFQHARSRPASTPLESEKFVVMPLLDAPRKVFGFAIPCFVVATISIILVVIADSSDRHSMFTIASSVFVAAIFAGLVLVNYRISHVACPNCHHRCRKRVLENRNWGVLCEHCKIAWDTGIGSED